MIYCINPNCQERENPDNAEVCEYCGNPLIIENHPEFKSEKKYRLQLIKPAQELHPMRPVEVFEAKDIDTGEIRVLKLLKTPFLKVFELHRFDFYIEHFEREFETLKLFDHPGIPRVNFEDYLTFDLITGPNTIHCINFPKIEGVDLKQWMSQNPKLSHEQAYDWLSQIANILHHVHQLGFFHRDIKPSNIMLQPNGKLMLIDFGGVRRISSSYLAKVSTAENTTGDGRPDDVSILMSHGYTPLEQFNGKALPQSDFYALGRTLIRLVTGKDFSKLPIDEKTGNNQWRQEAPQIAKPLADFIDELSAVAPTDRPKSTREILARLEKLPRRIKWQQRLHSPTFKIMGVLLMSLFVLGLVKGGSVFIAERYFRLAMEQQLKGDLKSARTSYEWAIRLDGNNKTAYNNLGLVCRGLGDLPCVLENYKRGLKIKPDDKTIFYNLGGIYEDFQDYKKAREYYQQSIDASQGKFSPPISNLARLDLLDQKPQKAEVQIREILDQSAHDRVKASLYKNLGWSQYQQKQYAQAVVSLNKSLEFNGEEVSPYCLLAKAENALGQPSAMNWEICFLVKSKLPEVEEWRRQYIQKKENESKTSAWIYLSQPDKLIS